MPKYELTYFNARGGGEITRLLFVVADVPFEDIRVEKADWPAIKHEKRFPFQQMPVLKLEDGFILAQSNAIARYVANEFGLAGKTNLEKARVDMVVYATDDVFKPMIEYLFAPEDKKEAVAKELISTKLPPGMANLERLLTSNNGGDGYFVGDSVTMADLFFLCRFGDNLRIINPDFLKQYPKLNGLVERLYAMPKIKAWVAKRPDTPF